MTKQEIDKLVFDVSVAVAQRWKNVELSVEQVRYIVEVGVRFGEAHPLDPKKVHLLIGFLANSECKCDLFPGPCGHAIAWDLAKSLEIKKE